MTNLDYLRNRRLMDLVYARVQSRQDDSESLPSCSCGSSPRMSAQAMQHYGRGQHGPGSSKNVDLRHHDGSISSGRVVEERGRTRDSWVVEWSSGPLSGGATLFTHVQLPGETDLGRLSLRETAESLPRSGRARSIRDAEDHGRNSVYDANIADAGLTAAWRGMTESLPTKPQKAHGDFDPRDWSTQNIIASTMRWEPHAHLYYELLSIRPDATDSEIYRAWRTAQAQPANPLAERRKFMLRKQAYDVLSNAEWRRDYDANGSLDASFRGLRRRVAQATTTLSSGDAMSDGSREILLAVNDMGPEAYAAHSGRGLPDLVALLKQVLHEVEADDAKYRLPSRREAVESLPRSPGRMGDGAQAFRPNQHVIRLGDMIKQEGALGGYVESVDRIKGTAKIEQDNGVLTTWPLISLLHDTKANRDLQQKHNDKIDAEVEARLERSLANWKAL